MRSWQFSKCCTVILGGWPAPPTALIYTTACHFCLYVTRSRSLSRTAEFSSGSLAHTRALLSKATYSAFRLYICIVSMCSLGIEPTTFALLTQCSNHWATGTHIHTHTYTHTHKHWHTHTHTHTHKHSHAHAHAHTHTHTACTWTHTHTHTHTVSTLPLVFVNIKLQNDYLNMTSACVKYITIVRYNVRNRLLLQLLKPYFEGIIIQYVFNVLIVIFPLYSKE